MLELPHSGKFYVDSISYAGQRIDLYDPDGWIDPRQLRIPDLTSSPFDFYRTYNITFFNCSTLKDSPSPLDYFVRIPCLGSTHHCQIVALESDEDAINVPQSCRKMYDRRYISLLWNNPMCRTCYTFGQKCTRIGNTLETRCLLNISEQKTGIYYLISSIYFNVDPLELSLNLCKRGICLILRGIVS